MPRQKKQRDSWIVTKCSKRMRKSLWVKCTSIVKNELEALNDCDDMKSKEDPMSIEVSLAISETKTCNGVWCANKQLHNCIQKEDEDIKTSHDRFKNQVEIIKIHGGVKFCHFNF